MSSDIGGCPILNFLAFLYRGHPDPLTTYTTGLHLLSDHEDMAKRMYIWLMLRMYSLGQGKAELLISNPCSLNIDLPYNLSSKIRKDLEDVLIKITRNVHLKEIFNEASKKRDDFFSYLISSDPCHPCRIRHEIFRNSITGAKLTFISKFSNTRTTQVLFGSNQTSNQILREIYTSDVATILHWINLFQELKSINAEAVTHLMCPTKLAQMLRDDTWTYLLDGRPIEGVTVPHPVHQFSACPPRDLKEIVVDENYEHITFFSPKA
jgi:hypothetical protein